MRKFKRTLALVVSAVVIGSAAMPAPVFAENVTQTKSVKTGVNLKVKEGKTPTYKYGETKDLTLTIANNTEASIENVRITPRVKASIDKLPFEIDKVDYETKIGKIEAGKTAEITYKLTARDAIKDGYYYVKFDVIYDGLEDSFEQGVFVKTTAKPEPEKPAEEPGNTQPPANDPPTHQPQDPIQPGDGGFSGGGFDNADVGGDDQGVTSVPRVIVTGFSTEPKEVKAGSNFKLIVHLRNTSKETAVRNMLFDFNAPTEGSDANTASPAFLPSSGSSTVYLEEIAANGTKDISIDLNAKMDLVQKPYSIDMSMKYEDKSGGQFESSSSISVPIKQDARFEFSEFELSSETIEVGSEVNVMCSLYNMGRIKLYNVKAKFEGEGLKSKEIFVGNVEPGATATIDGMVTGEKETTGDGKAKMIVTYEDEAGSVFTTEKELVLLVTPPMMNDMPTVDIDGVMTEEEKAFPVIPVVVLVLLAAGIAAFIIIRKRKQKKSQMEEEDLLEDELNRLTEDE